MIDNVVEYDLSKYDRLSIGRSEKSDLKLEGKSVSRLHAVIFNTKDGYVIEDQQSTMGTLLNNKKLTGKSLLRNGDIITIVDHQITYAEGIITCGTKTKAEASKKIWDGSSYPNDYRRTPRLKKEVPQDLIEIDAPPSAVKAPEARWFQMLASPVTTIIIMVLMSVLSVAAPSMMIFTIPMSLISIIMTVTNYFSTKKSAEKNSILRDKKYGEYLEEIVTKIRRLKKKQIEALSQDSPSLRECVEIVSTKENRLWSKRPSDADFLSVRIGSGQCAASFSVKGIREGFTMDEDPLVDKVKEITSEASVVDGAPVECDILRDRLVGIIGSRRAVINAGKNIMVELSTMHSYEDVNIISLCKASEKKDWEFLKWLPHSFDIDKMSRYYATNVADMEQMLKGVEEILKSRDLKTGENKNRTFLPHYVLLVTDESQLNIQPTIWKYIFEKENLGISAILLFDEMDRLPKECNTIIEVTETKGVIFSKHNTDKKTRFMLEHIRADIGEYEQFARNMAPIRSVGGAAESTLPKTITFFEGYGIGSPDEIDIAGNWKKARPQVSMAVPIGIRANGDQFMFDIFETVHGPHGLVAGTTGSGKTEIIQTWILSMALHFSPKDVSFVLMDFKGTNLILPFADLPHVSGTISDIDTNIERNKQALESEMIRRERLFNEHKVTNIKDYLDKYHDGHEDDMEPIPFLFIVVDEFAELKAQFPEFMTWIESTFAKGRSLGLYIILMTQKPDGVVSEKMDANAKFRICLRTQTTADSKAMLKHEDAAFIRNPGRAYIRVGEDEVYDLIQSYYCNASVKENVKAEKEYSVSIIDDLGRRIEYVNPERNTEKKQKTVEERALLVKYIAEYVEANDIPKARRVWTERLDKEIPLETIETCSYNDGKWPTADSGLSINVGEIDDPAGQAKYPLTIDFVKDGHVVVYGSPQSGKTTFVQTVIMAAIRKYSTEYLSVYGIDCGSHILPGLFGGFPQVGSIVNDTDENQLEKLINFLKYMLEDRKKAFAKEGVTNLETYCQVTNTKLPYILVCIDRYESLREMYPDYDEFISLLSREAGSYGMYLFITAGNLNAVGYKMIQNIKVMMAMQLADAGDYPGIVGRTGGFVPESCPGRGLIKGTPPLEFQAAIPVQGNSEAERILAIKTLANDMTQNSHAKAKTVSTYIDDNSSINTRTSAKMDDLSDFDEYDKSESLVTSLDENTADINAIYENCVEKLNSERVFAIVGSVDKTKQIVEKYLSKQGIVGKGYFIDLGKRVSVPDDYKTINMDEFEAFFEDFIEELNRRKISSEEMEHIHIWFYDYKQIISEVSDRAKKRLGNLARLSEGLNLSIRLTIGYEEYLELVESSEGMCMWIDNSDKKIILKG